MWTPTLSLQTNSEFVQESEELTSEDTDVDLQASELWEIRWPSTVKLGPRDAGTMRSQDDARWTVTCLVRMDCDRLLNPLGQQLPEEGVGRTYSHNTFCGGVFILH